MEFPSTQWHLLAQATLHGDSAGRDALAEFVGRYREPIKAFILSRGVATDEAEDLTHDFFVHVMEKATLRRADPRRGRFRSFLLGALIRFLSNSKERREAQKRGGGETPVPLESAERLGDQREHILPEDTLAYDREWAVHLLRRALAAVEKRYTERGRPDDFAALRTYLPGSPYAPPYEEAAAQLGVSLGALKTQVHRARERLREALRREIASTLSSPEDIEDEVAYLGRVLQEATKGNVRPLVP